MDTAGRNLIMKKFLLLILFTSFSLIGFSQADKKVFGKLTVTDTVITDKGYKFPDGSFQSTAGGGGVNVSDSLKAGVTDSLLITPNALVVRTNGKVGIGTANPFSQLEISQNSSVSGATFGLERVDASVTLNNSIGAILFLGGEDGTSSAVGSIINNADGAWTATSSPTFMQFRTTITGNTSDTERMRIASNGNVGIGTSSPNSTLDVTGTGGAVVGGFASGALHITSPSALINANAVITGHNSFGGNKQLWYLGSASSSTDDITLINRQNGNMTFFTNNIERMKITAAGLVQTDNLQLDGNTISTTTGDLDITTQSGGVFKFDDDAVFAGADSSNQLELGHGGSNAFVNNTGAGGIDFRFIGATLASFTSSGHLHLTSTVDLKHNLKLKTNNNANTTGIAWENSGGAFTSTIFRDDIGSNRTDMFWAIGIDVDVDLLTNVFRIDGSIANLGNIEFFNNVGIGITNPSEKLEISGNIKTDSSVIYTPISSVPHEEGKVYYDNEDKALSLKTDIVGSTQSLGQEFWVRVINKTGVSISDGSLVYISGFDGASGRPTIALGKADLEATSNVIGFVTNIMADGAEGFVVPMGYINDLNTIGFISGIEIFLSDVTAGTFTSTKPLNAIPVGFITEVNASTGQILAMFSRKIIDSPIFAQLSDATNQKPTTTSPTVITFDTNDDIRGITHSASTATEDLIISIPGTYTFYAQPQVERTSGASAQEFHMWFRIGIDDKDTIIDVSIANPSVIRTRIAHGLTTGQTVDITNTTITPDINAQHIITVTSDTTYTIPVNVTSVTDTIGNWRRILDVNDDVANSNVELRISGSNDADVIPLIITRDMIVGEKINVMQSVSTTGNGIGLVVINPSGEPRIPSIIFAINKN